MSLENRLRHALGRVEPQQDLAAGVLARLEAERAPQPARSRWQAPRWALAASLVMAVGAGFIVQHQREHARGEAASRQLAVALELTSRELQNIHQHLDRRTGETGT